MIHIISVLFGCIPFLVGGILNYVMLYFPTISMPLLPSGLLFLVLWGFIATRLRKHSKKTFGVVVCINSVATVVLVLLGIQEILLGQYFFNAVGLWTQYFYLPLLSIGYRLTPWATSVFAAYCASFLLMIVATFVGCYTFEKNLKKKDDLYSST